MELGNVHTLLAVFSQAHLGWGNECKNANKYERKAAPLGDASHA